MKKILLIFIVTFIFSCKEESKVIKEEIFEKIEELEIYEFTEKDKIEKETIYDTIPGEETIQDILELFEISEISELKEQIEDKIEDAIQDKLEEIIEETFEEIIEEEIITPSYPVGLRINKFNILTPLLCYPGPSIPELTCEKFTQIVNQMFDSYLLDSTNPIDIIGIFNPFDFKEEIVSFIIANAVCNREGDVITDCMPIIDPLQGTYKETFAYLSKNNTCSKAAPQFSSMHNPPCFYTQLIDQVLFKLIPLGIELGLLNARISGHFNLSDKVLIDEGYIYGFLPEIYAKKVQICYASFCFTLDEFLQNSPKISYQNIQGWELTFYYSANEVPVFFPLY